MIEIPGISFGSMEGLTALPPNCHKYINMKLKINVLKIFLRISQTNKNTCMHGRDFLHFKSQMFYFLLTSEKVQPGLWTSPGDVRASGAVCSWGRKEIYPMI